MLEVSIGASSDCASGESRAMVAEDRTDAVWVRIGRGFDECERLSLPQVLGSASTVVLASSNEGSPLSAEREDQALSPVDAALPMVALASGGIEEAGPFFTSGGSLWAPDPIPGAEPGLGSEVEFEPTPVPQPESVPELAPLVESAPESPPVSQPEPVQESSPASQLAPVFGFASPTESIVNPKVFEATMTPEMSVQMGAANDAEAIVLRHVEGNSSLEPTAFLPYGDTTPTEVTRDIVIGCDPDPRAISGRPAMRALRALNPVTEISRPHCAMMVTAPGVWSLMDMGSTSGILLRHGDGSFEEVTPMVMSSLSDGDLIDVGEGTMIELRVR